MKKSLLSMFIVGGVLSACERIEYFPDKPLLNTQTYIIGHRGGGTYDDGGLMEGCKRALSIVDGIEIDIQKSADKTLWLSHSSYTESCGSFGQRCFPTTSDKTIIEIDSCMGNAFSYTRLESVFQYVSENYPEKFVSLDVKAWKPCELSNFNVRKQMNEMAQMIINLTVQYQLEHVMVESESGDFLYYIKEHTGKIETYLVTLGDFELGVSRALANGYSGISFQYKVKENITKDLVDLIHRKGLKIQVWLVNEQSDVNEARSIGVDFIQTDYL
jgi:glycerophosphoryl diester phosphodiesterase